MLFGGSCESCAHAESNLAGLDRVETCSTIVCVIFLPEPLFSGISGLDLFGFKRTAEEAPRKSPLDLRLSIILRKQECPGI